MRGLGQGHVQIPTRIRGREKSAARDPQKSHSGTSPTCATSSQRFECAAVICYRSQPRTGEPFRPHTRECQGTLGAECGNRQGHARLHHLSRPLLSWPPRPLVSKGSPQPPDADFVASPLARELLCSRESSTQKTCVLNFGIWAFPGLPPGKRQDFIFYQSQSPLHGPRLALLVLVMSTASLVWEDRAFHQEVVHSLACVAEVLNKFGGCHPLPPVCSPTFSHPPVGEVETPPCSARSGLCP